MWCYTLHASETVFLNGLGYSTVSVSAESNYSLTVSLLFTAVTGKTTFSWSLPETW